MPGSHDGGGPMGPSHRGAPYLGGADHPHSTAAAAVSRLEDDGETDPVGEVLRLRQCRYRRRSPRHHRYLFRSLLPN